MQALSRRDRTAGADPAADAPTTPEPRATDGSRQALVAELERRIHELEQHAEEHFGAFDRRDWILATALGLVIPVVLLLVFWP